MTNKEIVLKNKQDLKELEQNLIDKKIEEMPKFIEQKKEEIVKEIIQYSKENLCPCKWDRDGNPIEYKVKLNPLVINNYFFKPVTNLGCVEPCYSPEKLSIVFDYYCEILSEVNDKIGYFPPSLTSFCKLASITTNTLRRWKNSDDYCMRTIVEKIYDQVGDENITMAQMGIVKETSTLFKMKSQNEMVEKAKPNVNISAKIVDVDLDDINDKINNYKLLVDKKGKN